MAGASRGSCRPLRSRLSAVVALSFAKADGPAATSDLRPQPIPGLFLPISLLQRADDPKMAFTVSPGFAGPNDVNLRDVNGDVRPDSLVTTLSYLDDRAAGEEQRPVQLHEGHRPLDACGLPFAGPWRIKVAVSRDGLTDARFTFEMLLPRR